MTRPYILRLLLLLLNIFGITSIANAQPKSGGASYAALWQKLDSLEGLGLTESARIVTESIRDKARQESQSAELVKAVVYRMKFIDYREEDALAKNLSTIQEEIDAAVFPERPLLFSMKAELLWRYYQENRYRILDRGISAQDSTADPAQWDVARFVRETHAAYQASLINAADQKRVQVNSFDPVLLPGNTAEARRFRPSLYDFLAHRAIDFYKQEESGLTRPIQSFSINSAFYLNEADLFLNFLLKTEDTLSFDFQAIRLLQDLLDFHQDDTHPGAYIDLDLERLRFVYDRLTIANRDTLYLKAVQRIADRYRNFPGSSDALFAIADWYASRACDRNESNTDSCAAYRKRAFAYCEEGISRFPYSQGGLNAKALRAQLLAPDLGLTLEKTQLPARPILSSLNYRNVDSVWYKIVRLDDAFFESLQRENERQTEEKRLRRYLRQPVVEEGVWVLPSSTDLNNHRIEEAFPALQLGRYAVLLATTPGFSTDRQAVVYADFQVSRITLRIRRPDDAALEMFVTDGVSGRALPGASVRLFTEQYDYRKHVYTEHEVAVGTTGPDGSIVIPGSDETYASRITIIAGEDKLHTDGQTLYLHKQRREKATYRKDVFFTDRSLYRPGQTIYFKALMMDAGAVTSATLPNLPVAVRLIDPNNEVVDSVSLRSSSFGSVHGQFRIPVGRMSGSWRLQSSEGQGFCRFQVEEYKRPTFEVKLDPTRSTARPGDRLVITGSANAYTGVAIQNGRVNYRVHRRSRLPVWYFGPRKMFPAGNAQEIAHGVVATDDAGKFRFEFDAIPDAQLKPEDRPEYTYSIETDVTDINGETRSAQREVPVAHVPLRVVLNLPERIAKGDAATFPVKTTNLEGQRVNTNAVVRVWQLGEPQGALRPRVWPAPDQFAMTEQEFSQRFPLDVYDNRVEPESWEQQRQVVERTFDTSLDTILDLRQLKDLPVGWYRLECVAINAQRQEAKEVRHFLLFDPEGEAVPTPELAWFDASPAKAEPGSSVRILFGSRLPEVHWVYEVEREGKIVTRKSIVTNGTQTSMLEPVREQDRGNFSIHLSTSVGNRVYSFHHTVEVPHSDKKLDIQLETFRSELEPGKLERWKIRLRNPDQSPANAELLANLYDASLDAILPHSWQTSFHGTRAQTQFVQPYFSGPIQGNTVATKWYEIPPSGWREYDQLNWFGYSGWSRRYFLDAVSMDAVMIQTAVAGEAKPKGSISSEVTLGDKAEAPVPAIPNQTGSTGSVEQPIRGNLQETAFFFPELKADANGDVLLEFDSPEALTRWKLMLLGHDQELRTAYREESVVTKKNIMVMPNLPRFFRAGDRVDLPVKVDNLFPGESSVSIRVELSLLDAATLQPVDDAFQNSRGVQVITAKSGSSVLGVFTLQIPERMEPVVVRIVATANGSSDGEEHLLPVLSDRMLITEAKPFVVRGDSTRTVRFAAMEETRSTSLKPVAFTLSYTPDPVWFAIQALPYLKEYPHECAEQLFSRYFANTVSAAILKRRPGLEAIFSRWRNAEPKALLSQLERNPELKQIALEETPWLLAARDESERKRNIGLLFDLDRQRSESQTSLERLRQSQHPDGSWSWFKGMPGDEYITRYIVEGMGRMSRMGVLDLTLNRDAQQMTQQALRFLDDRFLASCREQEKLAGHDTLPAAIEDLHYLFVRSCFVQEAGKELQSKLDYCYKRAQIRWSRLPLLSQSMLLRVAVRRGDEALRKAMVESLLERSLTNPEEGRWWKQDVPAYYWWSAPVETQANLIEALDEAKAGASVVDDLKTWLLRQKQTQDWKTTRATVQACFALLNSGTDWLEHKNTAVLRLGEQMLDITSDAETGTGTIERSWAGDAIQSAFSRLEIRPQSGNSISWGALYWQYTERMDMVRSTAAPFSITKAVFVERTGNSGQVLESLADSTQLLQGDRIVIRMTLQVDRDMDYVHLADPRVGGLEPEQVLSETRWQSGTCWYQSTRDAATHFFFPRLQKGTYVISYPLRAFQSGSYTCGPAQLQCLYAPEFSAHSAGSRISISKE